MNRLSGLLTTSFLLLAMSCGTVPTPKPIEPARIQGEFRKPSAQTVVLVVLENKNAALARSQKFLGHLAATGAYLSNYFGVAHPSQPNYVALVSGSIAGVRGDAKARLARSHLGQKIDSWKVYAQGYPSGTCDLNPSIGRYARKHEPFASFVDVQDDKEFCRAHITDFEEFKQDALHHQLPKFALVVPDLDDDAHDKPIAYADKWLETNFSLLINDPIFRRDVLLVVTFDENDAKFPYLHRNDNRVYTVLWGDSIIPGEVKTAYNHYDLLRTIEAIFALQPMAEGDRAATPIVGIWR